MVKWRDIKSKMLGHVHKTFEVPAVYLTHSAGTALRVTVRVRTRQSRVENEFTWPNTPGYLELDPSVVFDTSEVAKPAPNAFLFVGASEVYRIGAAKGVRDGYVAVEVTEAKDTDIAAVLAPLGGTFDDTWSGIYP